MHADVATRYPDEIAYWFTNDVAYATCHMGAAMSPVDRIMRWGRHAFAVVEEDQSEILYAIMYTLHGHVLD